MSKIRVYEIAKELGLSNKELLNTLKEFDITVKNHMSSLTDEEAKLITEYYASEEEKEEVVDNTQEAVAADLESNEETVLIPEMVTVKTLAEKLDKQTSDIVKKSYVKRCYGYSQSRN